MSDYDIRKFIKPCLNKIYVKKEFNISCIQYRKNRAIIYFFAPAGYGKTTAALLSIKENKYSFAWLAADKYDSSLKCFCRNLLLSLSFAIREKYQHRNKILIDEASHAYAAKDSLKYLLEIISKIESRNFPDVIVIDDFQNCHHIKICNALLLIKTHLPEKTRILIISRLPPADEFLKLIINNEISIFTAKDFCFEKSDIVKLLNLYNFFLDVNTIELLLQKTDGWIMAIIIIFNILKTKEYVNFNTINKLSEEIIYTYFKTEYYKLWSKKVKQFLIKTSIMEDFDLEFCKEVIGFSTSKSVLQKIMRQTGFITFLENSRFKYHNIFRKFLNHEWISDTSIDKKIFYKKTIRWLCTQNFTAAALKIITEYGNIDLIDDIIQYIPYGAEISIEDYAIAVREAVLKHISLSELYNYPNICVRFAWVCFLTGELKDMQKLIQDIKKIIKSNLLYSYETTMALLICAIEPGINSWDMLTLFENQLTPLFPDKKFFNSIIHNMPFFHKAQKDYADIAPHLEKFLESSKKILFPFLGIFYEPLHYLLAAGIYYEKYKLDKAVEMLNLVKNKENLMEIEFSKNIMMAEILFLQGEKKEAKQFLNIIRYKITSSNIQYFDKNFKAYETLEKLYNGDQNAADEWLKLNLIELYMPIVFFKCFRNKVTAISLIVKGDFPKAITFLDKLMGTSKNSEKSMIK